jgi:hypothetical protein
MYMGEIELITKIMRRVYGRTRTNFGTMKKKDKNQYVSVVCVFVRLQDACCAY